VSFVAPRSPILLHRLFAARLGHDPKSLAAPPHGFFSGLLGRPGGCPDAAGAYDARMGELELIRRFRAAPPGHPWLKVGPGQDCAILGWPGDRGLAYKIDQVVEGVHFVLTGPERATARQVGWKAMAKACSDIAAVGFWPVATTVAVNLRRDLEDAWALELYEGLVACCRRFSFALAGGDLATGGPAVSVCVSLIGEGPTGGAWLRSGARAGDALLVTGELGGSRGGKHLDFLPRLEESRRLRELAGAAVHACIDVTDGLSRDLGHLCAESRCGATLDEVALPVSPAARSARDGRSALEHVLGDGEDFELLVALDPAEADRLLKAWDCGTPLRQVGRIEPAAVGRQLQRADGSRIGLPDVGYAHRTASDGPPIES
jgi:thiamine-monophosphate kinase